MRGRRGGPGYVAGNDRRSRESGRRQFLLIAPRGNTDARSGIHRRPSGERLARLAREGRRRPPVRGSFVQPCCSRGSPAPCRSVAERRTIESFCCGMTDLVHPNDVRCHAWDTSIPQRILCIRGKLFPFGRAFRTADGRLQDDLRVGRVGAPAFRPSVAQRLSAHRGPTAVRMVVQCPAMRRRSGKVRLWTTAGVRAGRCFCAAGTRRSCRCGPESRPAPTGGATPCGSVMDFRPTEQVL